MREIISKADLETLRSIGDPAVDTRLSAGEATNLIDLIRAEGGSHFASALGDSALVATGDIHIEPDKLRRAQHLFAEYGNEIAGALLLAALPQSYAARWGSRVLVASARLQDDFRRRIVGTSQFLLLAMRGAKDEKEACAFWSPPARPRYPGSEITPPWKACAGVRLYHGAMRKDLDDRRVKDEDLAELLGDHNSPPLNQEDMLATLLAFTVTVFDVLERYGIAWTADDQEAYLHAWDVIGAHLGVGYPAVREKLSSSLQETMKAEHWQGLRPPTVADSRLLLDQLQARQWLPCAAPPVPEGKADGKADKADGNADDKADDNADREWESGRSGRVLLRALLSELAPAMPARMRSLPLAVMRELSPPIVRDRLNLGGGGMFFSMVGLLPKRRIVVDRFTALEVANPVGGTVLRLAANDVTRRVIVRLIRTHGLVIPDLARWSDGLADTMDVGLSS